MTGTPRLFKRLGELTFLSAMELHPMVNGSTQDARFVTMVCVQNQIGNLMTEIKGKKLVGAEKLHTHYIKYFNLKHTIDGSA